jgi:hypothetical protein
MQGHTIFNFGVLLLEWRFGHTEFARQHVIERSKNDFVVVKDFSQCLLTLDSAIIGQFDLQYVSDRLSSPPTPQQLVRPILFFYFVKSSGNFWYPTPVFVFQISFPVRNVKNT